MKWLAQILFFVLLLSNMPFQANGQELKPLSIEQHLQQAERNIEKGDQKEASRHLNEAAIIAWEVKDYLPAIEYFERSIELNRQINNYSGIAKIQSNLGMIYSDLQDYIKSLGYFQKSLNYRAEYGEKPEIISTYINKAVVLNNLKRYEEAANNLEEALRLATEMSDAAQMKSCYGMLAETYEKAGDQQKTIHYFNLYRTFHEMIQRNKVSEAKKETEAERLKVLELELQKKEQEIVLLNASKELAESEAELEKMDAEVRSLVENQTKQELAIKLLESEVAVDKLRLAETEAANAKQKLLTYVIVAAFLLLLFIALLILRNYRYKKNVNQRLFEQNEEIKALNDNLEAQVQARTVELQKAMTNLQKRNENLDQFSHVISHNLRGPVARILGLGNLLNLDEAQTATNPEVMKRLVDATKDLDSVVKDLSTILDINDNDEVPLSTVGIGQSLENVERLLQDEIDGSGLKIYKDLRTDEALAVKSYLESIFYNLISNAIKYTPEEKTPEVAICVTPGNDCLKITVKDNGMGISKHHFERIFEPYNRLSNSGSGKGLGLYLVKTQAEAMGGKVTLESEPGLGTTFIVELPLEPYKT